MKGPRDPRFHNKDGTITRYAFICGYIETYAHGVHIELESREINLWSIKGPLQAAAQSNQDCRRWVQTEKGVKEARRIARRMAADPETAKDNKIMDERIAFIMRRAA